jgi:sn-glycerol 3-phosphate transport system ATP-binding protein
MNLLTGEVRDGVFHVGPPEAGLNVSLPAPPPRPGPLILGIRPEHLVSNGAVGARLTLRVDMVEALGADSYAYGEGALPGSHLVARLPGGPSPALGTILPFTFSAEHVHWFDPATGRRIP